MQYINTKIAYNRGGGGGDGLQHIFRSIFICSLLYLFQCYDVETVYGLMNTALLVMLINKDFIS